MSSTPLEVLGLIFDEMAAGEDKFEVAAMLTASHHWTHISPIILMPISRDDIVARVNWQIEAHVNGSRGRLLHLRWRYELTPFLMKHFLRWKDRWASVVFERRCIIPQQYPFARGGLYYMMGHDPCPNMTRLCVRIIGADIARYSNVFDNSAPRGLAQLVPQPTRLTSLEISLSVGARVRSHVVADMLRRCASTLENLKLDVPMTYSLPPRTITLARLRTLHICGDSGRLLQWTVLPGVEEIRLERITNSHSSDLWNCFWDGLRKGTIGAGSIQAMALINAMWDYGPEMRSSIDVTKNVKQLTMMVVEDDPFDVPAILSRTLARVCRSWNDRLGVDALLWSSVSPATALGKELSDDDREMRVKYQFAALKKHSRDVGLHLRLAQEDVPLLRPYLVDLADRWVSIVTDAQTWGDPSELTRLSGHRRLRQPLLPALRCLRLCMTDGGTATDFDLLRYGAAVEELDLYIERQNNHLPGQDQMVGRRDVPVPATLTSLALAVAEGVKFGTTILGRVLQSCSARLERLEIRLATTDDTMVATELPKLRELKVHGPACSLLRVLQVNALEVLWIHQDRDMSNSIFDYTPTLEQLALAYTEDDTYRPVCNAGLSVIALGREKIKSEEVSGSLTTTTMAPNGKSEEILGLLEAAMRARREAEEQTGKAEEEVEELIEQNAELAGEVKTLRDDRKSLEVALTAMKKDLDEARKQVLEAKKAYTVAMTHVGFANDIVTNLVKDHPVLDLLETAILGRHRAEEQCSRADNKIIGLAEELQRVGRENEELHAKVERGREQCTQVEKKASEAQRAFLDAMHALNQASNILVSPST
ncbi:hypothetical protein EV714DRAFT_277936 [Schizophyllum commune]